MNKWIPAIFGISLALAVVLYFVLQSIQETKTSIGTQNLKLEKSFNEFESDFATARMNFADKKEEKEGYKKVVEKKAEEIVKIDKKIEEVEKYATELSEKSKQDFKDYGTALDKSLGAKQKNFEKEFENF